MPAEPLKWLNKSNRKRADKNDKEKAKKDPRYFVVSNSGAGKNKLDLVGLSDAVETKFTDKASFTLKIADLKKCFYGVDRTAKRGTYRFGVMEITLKDPRGKKVTVTVLESHVYKMLLEEYENGK